MEMAIKWKCVGFTVESSIKVTLISGINVTDAIQLDFSWADNTNSLKYMAAIKK